MAERGQGAALGGDWKAHGGPKSAPCVAVKSGQFVQVRLLLLQVPPPSVQACRSAAHVA